MNNRTLASFRLPRIGAILGHPVYIYIYTVGVHIIYIHTHIYIYIYILYICQCVRNGSVERFSIASGEEKRRRRKKRERKGKKKKSKSIAGPISRGGNVSLPAGNDEECQLPSG